MGSTVLSLRIDGELLDRLRQHAARRGMSVQDYVVQTLVRDDFDQRFKAAVDETEKFYGAEGAAGIGAEGFPGGPEGA
ncbi:ribbon-helix-helix protein, CopG family [Streptomyces sp. PTD5-9]|uniref:ribbon-helix-helix protein, CopG family n=1 Tax=Streptomyces sp. PTD5-9 TaxID=3120150 RepID=UPI00300AF8F5